ncbi:acyl-CoA thioesterase [Streptomyces sp. NPDC087300]|uniref:acyl-CoA thioesterase n=1 Tax=Streptomyces sp. NPDC087300 TaxID=3365780 RepID=UPI0038125F3A
MRLHGLLCRLTPRYSDLDLFGHVNNIRLLELVQDALFSLAWPDEVDGLFSDGFFIARHEIDYHARMKRGFQPVPVEVWVEAVGNSSFTVRCACRQEGQRVFTTRSVVVARARREERARPLTPRERAYLTNHMCPSLG